MAQQQWGGGWELGRKERPHEEEVLDWIRTDGVRGRLRMIKSRYWRLRSRAGARLSGRRRHNR
eukprot:2480321-Pleurochrysis_carterae.AAC.1